ncbi:MAG: hypothetical protein ACLTZI_04160 [[Eubacterium] siraeum]
MVQYGRFYDDYDSAVIITAPVSSEKAKIQVAIWAKIQSNPR